MKTNETKRGVKTRTIQQVNQDSILLLDLLESNDRDGRKRAAFWKEEEKLGVWLDDGTLLVGLRPTETWMGRRTTADNPEASEDLYRKFNKSLKGLVDRFAK